MLSQFNPENERYRKNKNSAERDGVRFGDGASSRVWCGQASASMIYNCFKQV